MAPPPASSSNRRQRSVARPVANLGNTCYINAVLQALAHAPELCLAMDCQSHTASCPKARDNSREASPSESPEEGRSVGTRKSRRATAKKISKSNFCALCAFENHLEQVHDRTSTTPVAPNELVHGFMEHVAPWFKLGVQEDSHEFLRVLIDSMQKSCQHEEGDEDAKQQYPFLLFSGKVESTVTCTKCGASSSTFDPIEDIGLEVTAHPPAAKAGGRPNSTLSDVQSAFARFTRKETLEGYKCEKCDGGGQATKQTSLYSIPPILTLHLKRFSYGSDRISTTSAPSTRRGGRSELSQLSTPSIHPMPVFASRSGSAKIEGHVKFDDTFDLKPYLCESLKDQKQRSTPRICRLFAVIVHNGKNSHSGHYIAFVRSLAKNDWWKMDDGRVESATHAQVMAAEAYMLFYRVVQHPISNMFEESKRKTSTQQEVKQKPEASRKRPPPLTEPVIVTKKAKPLPKPEDWFQTDTNIPPSLVNLIRLAQDIVADNVELSPDCLTRVENAAKNSQGVPSVEFSDVLNVQSLRERLQDLFFKLAEYLDDPRFLKPRKVAIVEPDTADSLTFKTNKAWTVPASLNKGDVVKVNIPGDNDVPIFLRMHLMDCLHKLNVFASSKKRLLVLSGPPGSGKTCLATLWARMVSADARVLYLRYHEKSICNVYEVRGDSMGRLETADKSASLQVSDVCVWLKRHLTSREDSEPYDLCVLDGFRTTGASADLTSFILMNEMMRKTAVVTSEDIDTEGIPEDKLEFISMESWSWQDHMEAASSKLVSLDNVRNILQEDYNLLCNEELADDHLSADDKVKETVATKYHYAGGSARFMYGMGIEDLKSLFLRLFEKVPDWDAFAKGTIKLSAAKPLFQRFANKGIGDSTRTAVSKFVLLHSFEQSIGTTVAAVGFASQNTGNPTLKNWSFAVQQLGMIQTAVERKTSGQTCLGNSKVQFCLTSEVHFDGKFLSDPVKDGSIIWCQRWNQGSFDVAFFSAGTLVTILFTVENSYSLRVQAVKQLRSVLISMGVKVNSVAHLTVVGREDWEQYESGPVRGAGKASRRSEKAFSLDIGHVPRLEWVEQSSNQWETDRTVDIHIQK